MITIEDYSVESEDLCAESIASKKATLQKWQRKHRRCSCALMILALVFMALSSIHLLFPPRFEHMQKWMQKHGQRDPHDRQAPVEHGNGKHHGHGGRHLRRGGRNEEHDEEFFVVKNS